MPAEWTTTAETPPGDAGHDPSASPSRPQPTDRAYGRRPNHGRDQHRLDQGDGRRQPRKRRRHAGVAQRQSRHGDTWCAAPIPLKRRGDSSTRTLRCRSDSAFDGSGVRIDGSPHYSTKVEPTLKRRHSPGESSVLLAVSAAVDKSAPPSDSSPVAAAGQFPRLPTAARAPTPRGRTQTRSGPEAGARIGKSYPFDWKVILYIWTTPLLTFLPIGRRSAETSDPAEQEEKRYGAFVWLEGQSAPGGGY